MSVNHFKIACEPNTNYNYQNFRGQLISNQVLANCLTKGQRVVLKAKVA